MAEVGNSGLIFRRNASWKVLTRVSIKSNRVGKP